MQYMHYKVELALDRLEEAILIAKENGYPYEREFYGALLEKMIGIREESRDALIKMSIKNAAPAAGTTETAKGDSDNESNNSLEDNAENVKRSSLTLTVIGDGTVDARLIINGVNDHLMLLYSAAVESVVFAAPDLFLTVEALDRAHKRGVDRAMSRLKEKGKTRFANMSASSKERVLRTAKEMNIPEDLLKEIAGGEVK